MGYDDNSKLTGVTGGGLPADIWRETMVRVHESLPSRTLPMIRPLPVVDDLVTETPEGRPKTPRIGGGNLGQKIDEELKRLEDDAETILKKVLGSIFGRNN